MTRWTTFAVGMGMLVCFAGNAFAQDSTSPPPSTPPAAYSSPSNGGGHGMIGVGGIVYMGGTSGLSLAYDPGPWHIDALIGYSGVNDRLHLQYRWSILVPRQGQRERGPLGGAGASLVHNSPAGPGPSTDAVLIEAGALDPCLPGAQRGARARGAAWSWARPTPTASTLVPPARPWACSPTPAFTTSSRTRLLAGAELFAELLLAATARRRSFGGGELSVGVGQRAVDARVEGVGRQRPPRAARGPRRVAHGQQRLARDEVGPGEIGVEGLHRRERLERAIGLAQRQVGSPQLHREDPARDGSAAVPAGRPPSPPSRIRGRGPGPVAPEQHVAEAQIAERAPDSGRRDSASSSAGLAPRGDGAGLADVRGREVDGREGLVVLGDHEGPPAAARTRARSPPAAAATAMRASTPSRDLARWRRAAPPSRLARAGRRWRWRPRRRPASRPRPTAAWPSRGASPRS